MFGLCRFRKPRDPGGLARIVAWATVLAETPKSRACDLSLNSFLFWTVGGGLGPRGLITVELLEMEDVRGYDLS
jgi:hypothetical protein